MLQPIHQEIEDNSLLVDITLGQTKSPCAQAQSMASNYWWNVNFCLSLKMFLTNHRGQGNALVDAHSRAVKT